MQIKKADDKFYGLSTLDMIGFYAFLLDAVKNLTPALLSKPLYILVTSAEGTVASNTD